jgi:hypothetical protein
LPNGISSTIDGRQSARLRRPARIAYVLVPISLGLCRAYFRDAVGAQQSRAAPVASERGFRPRDDADGEGGFSPQHRTLHPAWKLAPMRDVDPNAGLLCVLAVIFVMSAYSALVRII